MKRRIISCLLAVALLWTIHQHAVPFLRQTEGSDQGSVLGRQRICAVIQAAGVRQLPVATE